MKKSIAFLFCLGLFYVTVFAVQPVIYVKSQNGTFAKKFKSQEDEISCTFFLDDKSNDLLLLAMIRRPRGSSFFVYQRQVRFCDGQGFVKQEYERAYIDTKNRMMFSLALDKGVSVFKYPFIVNSCMQSLQGLPSEWQKIVSTHH